YPTLRAGPGVPDKDDEARAFILGDGQGLAPSRLQRFRIICSQAETSQGKRHKEGCPMITLRWLAIAGASVLCAGMVEVSNVQAAAAPGPSGAVYCRGPLSTARTEGGKVIRTTFKWAKDAATKENPGPGECAWADHAPQGAEKAGDTAVLVGNL